MKKILLILCLIPFLGYSQVSYKIKADSTILSNIGSGKNELVIRNSTSGVTGGVLTNLGNGVTAFVISGGDSQTLSISGDTLSISNGNSVVLPIGASTLFPNGVKLVMSSRAFQADDKDYVLLCPVPGTIITMPTTNPFSEGDYIGVVMSSPDSYFETYNNGSGGTDKMYPYTANPTGTTLEQQSSSEVVILRALNQGTLWILPLCGAVKYSTDINGSNFKTLARYNYDYSQNAIPLSGTVSGSPVTGNIEVNNGFSLYSNGVDSGSYSAYSLDDIVAIISTNDGYTGYISSITLNPNYVSFSSTNPTSEGIVGIEDFTANITDLAYTQKKYVDSLVIKGSFDSGAVVAISTFTVTIPTQSDANYVVVTEATNLLSAAVRYVTNKTTTSFDVVYLSALTGTVDFDYILRK